MSTQEAPEVKKPSAPTCQEGFSVFKIAGANKEQIRAKTPGQAQALATIENSAISFITGPAGTGKTFLALCYGVYLLRKKKVKSIVLTRPPVEAGAEMGFLPGDKNEKFEPYVKPLRDNLEKIVGKAECDKLFKDGVVQAGPLNYMRGSTFDGLVILDEAQNCDRGSLEMFITRLGETGKFVITGDYEQTDLKKGVSGLKWAMDTLSGIEGIGYCEMGIDDIQRHKVVKEAILAFRRAKAIAQQPIRERAEIRLQA